MIFSKIKNWVPPLKNPGYALGVYPRLHRSTSLRPMLVEKRTPDIPKYCPSLRYNSIDSTKIITFLKHSRSSYPRMVNELVWKFFKKLILKDNQQKCYGNDDKS